MKTLDEIIEGAASDGVSLTSLLRKCLVIADRLKNDTLKAWVLSELNGYKKRETIPPYRIFPVQAVGTFLGPFAQLNDQPLTPTVLKEAHREWATTAYLPHQIASYEITIKEDKGDLFAPWPAEIVAHYQTKFLRDPDMVLNRAHQRIPRHAVVGMVDTVRNKLLEFALELRSEIGNKEPTPENPPPAIVEQQVTQIIYGGQTNIYGGSVRGDINQGIGQTVIKGDFNSLSKSLMEIGVPEVHHEGLKTALDTDQQSGHTTEIGPKTQGWMKRTLKAIGRGATTVGIAVTEKVLTSKILEYLGKLPM